MRRRPQRPDRTALERLLRSGNGSLTRVAGLLDVSRPTLYKWIYQLDLVRLAGISIVDGPYSLYSKARQVQENTEKSVNPQAPRGRNLEGVESVVTVAMDPRVNTSVRIRESLWKQMRKRAIDENRPVADLMEEAAAAYLVAKKPRRARTEGEDGGGGESE